MVISLMLLSAVNIYFIEFMFHFDFEGSVLAPEVMGLISSLKKENPDFVFLGNYSEV